MSHPRPLFRLFLVFSNKEYNFYKKSMWKKSCPSSIWRLDLNPRPLEHELSPITTRPGLPLCFNLLCPRSLRWMEDQSGGNLTHQLSIPWFNSYTVNDGKRYSFALLVFIEASQPFFWWQWRQIVVVNFCLFFPHHLTLTSSSEIFVFANLFADCNCHSWPLQVTPLQT